MSEIFKFEDLKDKDKQFFEEIGIDKSDKNTEIYFNFMKYKAKEMWEMLKEVIEEEVFEK